MTGFYLGYNDVGGVSFPYDTGQLGISGAYVFVYACTYASICHRYAARADCGLCTSNVHWLVWTTKMTNNEVGVLLHCASETKMNHTVIHRHLSIREGSSEIRLPTSAASKHAVDIMHVRLRARVRCLSGTLATIFTNFSSSHSCERCFFFLVKLWHTRKPGVVVVV